MKYTFDIFVSIALIIILLPVFIIITLLNIFMEGSPVLFCHMRIGKNGKPFQLYKFRTMTNSEEYEKGKFELGNTSRVTALGRILRKTKLDELPQLFNVVKGDMSIVGPRPEVEKWVNEFPERWQKILSVRPGITDNASILFRNEEALLASSGDPQKLYHEVILPRKMEIYEQYIENQSLWGDFKIIGLTLYYIAFK